MPMTSMRIALAAAVLALSFARVAAQQPARAAVPDITGSWERMGFGGRGNDAQRAFAPPPASQPPLKPEPRKEWQARVQAAREADAKGQPLATNVTHCIPDGMP